MIETIIEVVSLSGWPASLTKVINKCKYEVPFFFFFFGRFLFYLYAVDG